MKIMEKLNNYAESIIEPFRLHDVSPKNMVSNQEVRNQYKRKKSFTDFLPFVDYFDDKKMFLMEDCCSVAAGFEFSPINVEGFPLSELSKTRNMLMQVLKDTIPEEAENPWVVNVYFSNTYSLSKTISEICNFDKSVEQIGENDPVKKEFNRLYKQHLKGICSEKGIFTDTQVTNQIFNGKITTGRLFLYRKSVKDKRKTRTTPIEELNLVRDRLLNAFSKIGSDGISVKPLNDKNVYEWNFRWFNPNPSVTKGDVDKALELYPCPSNEDKILGGDFSSMFTLTPPVSDVKKGVWEFDKVKHKYLSVELVRQAPAIGALSVPKNGSSLFDAMPSGSIFAMTIVFQDKNSLEKDIKRIQNKAVGDGAIAEEAREEAEYAKRTLVRGETLLPIEMGFYIKGETFQELTDIKDSMTQIASQANLQILDDEFDPYSCDSYFRMMPGNYRWALNSERNRSIKLSLEHIANYMPVLGRGKGTGTPVQIQFNRGGEPMMYDIIGDRLANSHAVMIGSTGAGKSAKLVDKVLSYIAQYNARVVIIEKGNSFKLMVDYLKRMGKKTHRVKLSSGSGAVIPPYANAYKALEREDMLEEMINKSTNTFDEMNVDLDDEELECSEFDDAEEKDYLGEMELITRIFVTGGDADRNKELTLADQNFIRRAIINAAKKCQKEGKKHPLVSDVSEAMKQLMEDDNRMRESHLEKAYDFGEAIDYFTSGLAGEIFNQYGELWPESDVTHVDLGDVTRDGYEATLAVAYASVLNQINDIAERDQFSGRPIIVITDEGHNIVSKSSKASPILVPTVVKIVKMWRKLNAWYWIATQNIGDFSDDAGAILKLCEWWEVLAVEPGEDEEIARFKRLTDSQRAILSTVTIEARKYTEGFVMCRNKRLNNQLFRNIPVSTALTLAYSDPNEKRDLKVIMNDYGVNDLDAALIMADNLDVKRGII
jgi:conjugative transfer ATPase